jgi:sec-independent protein translocase protein TatA
MSLSFAVLAALGLGMPELLMILAILLLLFGGSKLPSLAKGLGQSVKEFKKATKDDDEQPAKPAAVVEAKKSEAAKTTVTTPGAN